MSRLKAVAIGLLGAAGAAVITAAVVAGTGQPGQGAAAVSPAAATATASSARVTGSPHGTWDPAELREQLEQWLPAELRSELAGLRDVPAADRLAELERIRDAALAGEYGEQARAGAQRLVAALAMLPPELVADLEALVSTEEAEIPDAVERIRDRALGGEYGEQVRGWAQQLVAVAEQHGYDVTGDLDRFAPGD